PRAWIPRVRDKAKQINVGASSKTQNWSPTCDPRTKHYRLGHDPALAQPCGVEQDLLLARTVVAIYEHPALRDELVFRGGTCLHQVHLPTPLRYSEDLDFVRRTHSGIGPILDALREVAAKVGLEVRGTTISEHPKLTLRGRSEDDPNLPLRIKFEIN